MFLNVPRKYSLINLVFCFVVIKLPGKIKHLIMILESLDFGRCLLPPSFAAQCADRELKCSR